MFERATRLCRMSPQIATVRPSMPALAAADGERVEQRLGRVLVAAVAGVDHGAVDLPASSATAPLSWWRTTSTSGCMAFSVIAVSISVSPFFIGRARDRHVDHVGAQPLAGELEAGLGAGRALEEQVDLGQALEQLQLLVGLPVERDVSRRRGRADRSISQGCRPSMPSRCLCWKARSSGRWASGADYAAAATERQGFWVRAGLGRAVAASICGYRRCNIARALPRSEGYQSEQRGTCSGPSVCIELGPCRMGRAEHGRASWWMDIMFGTSTNAGWCRLVILAAIQSAVGLSTLGGVATAQQLGPSTAAALSPATQDYFRALLPMFAKAPRPAKIYQQGGIPALVPKLEVDWNPFGKVGTYLPGGPINTADNAFFQALGTNGRSCATCHQPSSGMGLSLRNVRARFKATAGRDPLFAPVDGADCPSAVPGTDPEAATRARLARGDPQPRVDPHPAAMAAEGRAGQPKPVEFDITITPQEDKPGCNVRPGLRARGRLRLGLSPAADDGADELQDAAAGRQGPDPAGQPDVGRARTSLEQQAINATRATRRRPRRRRRRSCARSSSSRTRLHRPADRRRGRTAGCRGAKGGPIHLYRQTPEQAFGPTFDEYERWGRSADKRRSISRGQAIFNNRLFIVQAVAGFNDRPDVGNLAISSCSTCHNIAHAGSDALGQSAARHRHWRHGAVHRRAEAGGVLPRFTLTCHADAQPHPFLGRGPIVTNDPGLALLTGKCADIGKFTLPQLRALAAREPYFHDGTARTLKDVVDIYNRRFASA